MNRQADVLLSRRQSQVRTVWSTAAVLGLLMASACSGDVDGADDSNEGGAAASLGVGASATAGTGGSAGSAGSSSNAGSSVGGSAGSAGTATAGDGSGAADGSGASGGTAGVDATGGAGPTPEEEAAEAAILAASPFTQLRLLTRVEYVNSVRALLGNLDPEVVATLELPEDLSVQGFGTVGAASVNVSELAAEQYETASQALVRPVFNDEQRWQDLVGCSPQPDLSDGCVDTFVQNFGRRAFRRDLTDAEADLWTGLARTAASLTEDSEAAAPTGLAAAAAGIMQSPNFLYRVEYAEPDIELRRIRFDGLSMATRLAYLITGSSPDDALLDAAAAGELDTSDGVRGAVEQLFQQEGAAAFMSQFFTELTQLHLALGVQRDEETFPAVTPELRVSMMEETDRWISEVVLAPDADFRSFFNSRTTFVDGPLAEFYDLPAAGGPQQQQNTGFREVELGAETGRAGILGKAGFLMAHSSPDSSNPTRRGAFILKAFTCTNVPPPPPDLVVTVPEQSEEEGPKTTRELFEEHRLEDSTCIGCHQLMDPFGFALEHFDAVGQYRETENGLPIDATGSFQGADFDGAAELGEVLKDSDTTTACFVKNFYRYANGTADDRTDAKLIAGLTETLAEKNYVWRQLLAEFAASEAFNSVAPAALDVEDETAPDATDQDASEEE